MGDRAAALRGVDTRANVRCRAAVVTRTVAGASVGGVPFVPTVRKAVDIFFVATGVGGKHGTVETKVKGGCVVVVAVPTVLSIAIVMASVVVGVVIAGDDVVVVVAVVVLVAVDVVVVVVVPSNVPSTVVGLALLCVERKLLLQLLDRY